MTEWSLRESPCSIIALSDNEILGSVDFEEVSHTWEGSPYQAGEWRVSRLAVQEPHRGQGVGKALLEALTKGADQHGVSVVLEALPYGKGSKKKLITFYNSLGFLQVVGAPKGLLRRASLGKQ